MWLGDVCPDKPVTREAGATLVAKGVGLAPIAPATPSFSDVPASDPFYGFVEAAKAACITAGCSPTQFCPKDEMTRGQAAVFVALGFKLGGDPCQLPSDAGVDAGNPNDAAATGGGGGANDSGTGGTPSDSGSGGTWSDSGIPANGGTGANAGSAGGAKNDASSGGCGCSTPGGRSTPAGSLLALAAMVALAHASRRKARGTSPVADAEHHRYRRGT